MQQLGVRQFYSLAKVKELISDIRIYLAFVANELFELNLTCQDQL